MSSSVSGKFQDHYIALGLEPRADSDAIQAAYTKLAQKYHPATAETGNQEKFDAINMAFEVLSDPVMRLEFDKLKGIDHDADDPTFSGMGFFEALHKGAALRTAILCILCDRRRLKPGRPTLTLRVIESLLHITNDELSFAMWYLKQRGYVLIDDKGNLQLTADGMDFLEQNPPVAEAVMPLVKSEALGSASNGPPTVLNVLHKALTRDRLPVRAVAPLSK
jgi:curved DNA-binding protein